MSIIWAETYHRQFTDFARKIGLKPQLGGYGIDMQWKSRSTGKIMPYSGACWYSFMNTPEWTKDCVHINWNPFVSVYNEAQKDSPTCEETEERATFQLGEAGRMWMSRDAWIPAIKIDPDNLTTRDSRTWEIDSRYLDLCSFYANDLIKEWGMEHRISFHFPRRGLPNIQIDTRGLDFKTDLLHVVTGLRLLNEAPASVYAYYSMRNADIPRAWAILWAPHTVSTHIDSMFRGEHHYSTFFPINNLDKTLSTPLRLLDMNDAMSVRPKGHSFDSVIKKHITSLGLVLPSNCYYAPPYKFLWKFNEDSMRDFDVPKWADECEDNIRERQYPEQFQYQLFLDRLVDYQEAGDEESFFSEDADEDLLEQEGI